MTIWKKEFRKKWEIGILSIIDVENFISLTLAEAFKEVEEGLPEEAPHGSVSEYYSGFNACLAEVKEKIKEIKGKYL